MQTTRSPPKHPYALKKVGRGDKSSRMSNTCDALAIEFQGGVKEVNAVMTVSASQEEENWAVEVVKPLLAQPQSSFLDKEMEDQGISIVTELCEANKLKQVTSEIQGVCILLLQITVMALYLEFCVIQICGMRPVHGRVEDFSKEFHALTKASEGHAFLKESMNSLKQMASFVYPELLQAEDICRCEAFCPKNGYLEMGSYARSEARDLEYGKMWKEVTSWALPSQATGLRSHRVCGLMVACCDRIEWAWT
ncbi:hypothetical protein HAX54_040821 [Datura stramonium]|uniref:Uncharacterized protein n=1 Tax=Datura stramonium TaxID=4076 RepID=A0ABS8SKK5_DATST|nr:hypothetical protein [Datura stramonium]